MRYDRYRFSFPGWIAILAIWVIVVTAFSWFFYHSFWVAVFLGPFFPLYFREVKKECIQRRKWKLKSQFADALQGVSTALQSGNSMENAFRKVYSEMKSIYGKEADIVKEFYVIVKGIDNNITIETMISDFAARSQIEEIEDFSDIFIVGKRTGGNMRDMISVCCKTITEQIEIQREFRVLLASKQLELRIMCLVPFGMLLYIGTMSKGYFNALYGSLSGKIIMTGCLIAYIAACLWGRSIIETTKN